MKSKISGGYVIFLTVGAFIVGGLAGWVYTIGDVIDTQRAADRRFDMYLMKRFNEAYASKDLPILVWEGTNLQSVLKRRPLEQVPMEELRLRLRLEARLWDVRRRMGDTIGSAQQLLVFSNAMVRLGMMAIEDPAIVIEQILKE